MTFKHFPSMNSMLMSERNFPCIGFRYSSHMLPVKEDHNIVSPDVFFSMN